MTDIRTAYSVGEALLIADLQRAHAAPFQVVPRSWVTDALRPAHKDTAKVQGCVSKEHNEGSK